MVHPVTGDPVADHDVNPLWLGEPLPLDIDFIRRAVTADGTKETVTRQMDTTTSAR